MGRKPGPPAARPARIWAGRAAVAGFWLLVWQLAAWAVGQQLLLPGPAQTLWQLARLAAGPAFWRRAGFTALRVLGGFALGGCAGCLLAVPAAASPAVRRLLAAPMQLIKAAPVASFIILALLWVRSRWLPLLISGLMALPILYTALLEGILQTDPALREMLRVFRPGPLAALRAVWLPGVLPYLAQGLRLAIGLCWKSGVAAEIIGLPRGGMGEAFYAAKLALATGELFAWTAAVLLLSGLCGRALDLLLARAARRLCAPAPRADGKGGRAG